MSPSVYGFGCAPPYQSIGILSGSEYTQQPQPFHQNIDRRVDIPVVLCSAGWADPYPDAQIFHIRVLMPAAAAHLAAGEKCADLHDLLVLPSGLIL